MTKKIRRFSYRPAELHSLNKFKFKFRLKAIIDLVIFAQSKLDRLPEVVYDLINAGFIEGCIWIGSIIMMIQVYKYRKG